MTDQRQRRLVEEFLDRPGVERVEQLMATPLMAGRETAARRYAEAAFQLAPRDGHSTPAATGWSWPPPRSADERVLAHPAQPGDRARAARRDLVETALLGGRVSQPVLKLVGLMLEARQDRPLPRRGGGVPPARQRSAGHRPGGRDLRRAADAGRGRGAHRKTRPDDRRTVDLRVRSTKPDRRAHRPRRRHPVRRQRPGPPRAAAEPARGGRPSRRSDTDGHPFRRDRQHHQVRDRHVRRRRRDAQRRHGRRGRRRHRPDLRPRGRAGVRAARVPGRA